MMKIFILPAVLTTLISSGAALAIEKTVPLKAITSVDARQGINLTIKCASETSLVVSGAQKAVDKLQPELRDHQLVLINSASDDSLIGSDSLDITLFTATPLEAVSGQAGVKITLPSCAVDATKLVVTGSMGADINAEGKTRQLQLELAMGGTFNQKTDAFSAEEAQVRMSMGAEAQLCHVQKIDGSLAAGASLQVSPSAQVDTGALSSYGSKVSKSRCS
jgi:hypothetical protein